MKHTLSLLQLRCLFLNSAILLCALILAIASAQAQNCQNQITAESGTQQQFPCADVTVTSDGNVNQPSGNPCSMGAYRIVEGSWTFTFSTPVAGVTLGFEAFDYDNFPNPAVFEVATLDINGAPYPFPNPGLPSGCGPHAIVNIWGGLQASPVFGIGACKSVNITTPINTITVTNTFYNGYAAGIIFNIEFCCVPCETKAGLIPSAPLNLCPEEIATVPPAAPNVLPPGTILQYILFSDPGDTLGSIVLLSNTPSFSFDPALMEEGVTYYIAAIAGEELNGNVDLNDRCLDVSDMAVPVTWRPKPSVVFSAVNPDACQGACVDVTAEFSGEPPFTLTYTSTYTGLQTKTYASSFGIIQLCVPPSAPAGILDLQAIKLTDKYCVCE